ncbi:hypothetical protein [Frankia gtarii]|uniref:hypothetical protein n=1 Tax=Frankia gtarii TaxID=2950102 RepID=UPI0021C13DD4|nr:hypothetical protein [Frankia gtarii]
MSKWHFSRNENLDLDLEDPHVDTKTTAAVLDFLESDIGQNVQILQFYRENWEKLKTGEIESVSGNGTVQEIAGDRVLLESLYEQWESVYFTIAEFEELLDDYAAFLDSRRRPDAGS